ncbi:MAG: dockerin type I domain-containing protein [Planctomycetota bacterium]
MPFPSAAYTDTHGLSVTSNGDAIFATAIGRMPGIGVPMTWNPDTGTSTLPGIAGQNSTGLDAATADGRVGVGSTIANSTPPYGEAGAVVFTLGSGTRYLADVLADYGISRPRTDFRYSIDVSHDGRVIVGQGGIYPYWVVILPSPAPADFNVDGTVDMVDLMDFIDCFTGNSVLPVSSADMDGDGAVDCFDFDEFVRRFE